MKKVIGIGCLLLLVACTNTKVQDDVYVCEMIDNNEAYSQTIDFVYQKQEVKTIHIQSILPATSVSPQKLKQVQKKANAKYKEIDGIQASIEYDDDEEKVMLTLTVNVHQYDIETDALNIFSEDVKKKGQDIIHYQDLVTYFEKDEMYECYEE